MPPEPTPHRPLTVPPFECTLPEEFLKGLDDRGTYLYKTLDKVVQAQNWLTEQTVAQNNVLTEVKDQTLKTNGRVTQLEVDVKDMKEQTETVRFVKLVVKNRWFWIGTAAFFLFGVPWLALHASGATEVFKVLFGA